MKNKLIKISLALILSGLMFISLMSVAVNIGFDKLWAYFSAFSFEAEFGNTKPLSQMNFETLNDDEQKAYIAVFNKIKEHPVYIKIPELSNEEFNNVFFAVKNDNPDLLCFSDSCNMISFWSASFLQLHYSNDTETCNRMMNEMMSVADEIVSDIHGKNEFEKELLIHDRLVSHCTYSETINSSSAYGCLVEKEAVCSGYSRAAMILFYKAGIESMVVAGTGITPHDGEISHMWNIVWLDGSPYHVDITWDDPVSDSGSVLSHLYFNLSDEKIGVDHKNYTLNFVCNNDKYNYFVFNGTSYDNYNNSVLADMCKKLTQNIDAGNNYLEIVFTSDDAYNSAVNALINNSAGNSDMYTLIKYISDHSNGNIDMSHVNFSKEDARRYIRVFFDSK